MFATFSLFSILFMLHSELFILYFVAGVVVLIYYIFFNWRVRDFDNTVLSASVVCCILNLFVVFVFIFIITVDFIALAPVSNIAAMVVNVAIAVAAADDDDGSITKILLNTFTQSTYVTLK